MARINVRFALLVACLALFIGWGLVADAKPIEKPDEKEITKEVANNEDDSDDDADDTTRSKVQTHKHDEHDCKREFHVEGACHPFHEQPENENDGMNNYGDEDDVPPNARNHDSQEGTAENKEEEGDETKVEQDILNSEGEQRDTKGDSADAAAAGPDAENHAGGDQRDINGGNYDHHSSHCPCEHDLIVQTGHHGGHGCGCCHGAIGPSGVSIPCGCSGAGHLATYVCNQTSECCSPNLHCSNICGNVAMGLPHPECQLCTTQNKNQEACEKTFHPSCNLVCINGNVGLSLPHPSIQLDANQTCNQHLLTHGSDCGHSGHCGCGHCGCGFGDGGCCSDMHHCGCGRDDISANDQSIIASGNGPNDEEANTADPFTATPNISNTEAPVEVGNNGAVGKTLSEEVKYPAKRFDHHDDEVREDLVKGAGMEDPVRLSKRSLLELRQQNYL